MGFAERAQTGWTELQALGRMATIVPRFRPGARWSAARLLEDCARRWPDRAALLYEDRRYTWKELDRQVDRTARAFRELGIGPDDSVALLMDNRPEFVFAVLASSRLRARTALINNNIAGRALSHAITAGDARRVLVGAEHAGRVEEVLSDLGGLGREDVFVQRDGDEAPSSFAAFDDLVASSPDAPLAGVELPKVEDTMCYIYTSGTTGLPKAAIIRNSRFLMGGTLFGKGIFDLGSEDVIYVTLPLYHSNAMFGGLSGSLLTGACMALRRKFSATRFWEDVRGFDATAFVYIGELCRYLLNQPEDPEDGRHRLRIAGGNGLRPDIWERFQERFRIPLIREFYGSTEGTGGLVNFTGRPGMVGRLFGGNALVRCDAETGELFRGADGRCERVSEGDTGLLLTRIGALAPYDGYVDSKASAKKVVSGVFRDGDRFFDTGDLLTLHEDGWLSFADRAGDTFRWKGENVSTNEVAEILNGAPGVLESNVYGVKVPGTEGRAGMASLNCSQEFSLDAFETFVKEKLPVYQRPYFVRLQKEMRITGTFKHQKTDYRKEGYDPSAVSDPLFFLDGEKYVPLDAALHEGLRAGRVTLR